MVDSSHYNKGMVDRGGLLMLGDGGLLFAMAMVDQMLLVWRISIN